MEKGRKMTSWQAWKKVEKQDGYPCRKTGEETEQEITVMYMDSYSTTHSG